MTLREGRRTVGRWEGWSAAQLGHALALVAAQPFPVRRRPDGYWRPDTAVLSRRLDVAPSTVRGWFAGDLTAIPAERLKQISQLLDISEDTRRREALATRQHREYLRRRSLGRRRGNLAEYAVLGWLEPHLLALVHYPDLHLHRLAVVRAPTITDTALLGSAPVWRSPLLTRAARGGQIAGCRLHGTRFDALVQRDALMVQVDGWRLEVSPDLVSAGPTTVWVDHPVELD